MTEQQKAVITKEQARFLAHLELKSYAVKMDAIARANTELTFQSDYDREEFVKAVMADDWVIDTGHYLINVLAPLQEKGFITATTNNNPLSGEVVYTVTADVAKAALFTEKDLGSIKALQPYVKTEFLIAEYDAIKRYGNVMDWLNEADQGPRTVEESEVASPEGLTVADSSSGEQTVHHAKANYRIK
ncbi:hypothetical protein NKE67_09535 [Streptococcus suis]|uniref:hypothetical protein n=1 Tax=Streptococcus suis TaxID=1307 RepID=UPI00209B2BD4|nr:hypothetical protein [Streptococcus suis]MCO8223153.1 hypothetical protein [Streptococcus suis]HEM3470697.1 hypothetical protein [Streptococcus suis]